MKIKDVINDILKPALQQGQIAATKGIAGDIFGRFKPGSSIPEDSSFPYLDQIQRLEEVRPLEAFGRVYWQKEPQPQVFIGGTGIGSFEVLYLICLDRLVIPDKDTGFDRERIEKIDLIIWFPGDPWGEKGRIVYLSVNEQEIIQPPPQWATLIVDFEKKEMRLLGVCTTITDLQARLIKYLKKYGRVSYEELYKEFVRPSNYTNEQVQNWIGAQGFRYRKTIDALIKQLSQQRQFTKQESDELQKSLRQAFETEVTKEGNFVRFDPKGIVAVVGDIDAKIFAHIRDLAAYTFEQMIQCREKGTWLAVRNYANYLMTLQQGEGLRLEPDKLKWILLHKILAHDHLLDAAHNAYGPLFIHWGRVKMMWDDEIRNDLLIIKDIYGEGIIKTVQENVSDLLKKEEA